MGCWFAASALLCAPGASAQEADGSAPADDTKDIVVVGTHGSVVKDLAPITTLDTDAIAATGASTMGELLQAIRGTTQSADGSDPIFLLNGQRVSGYPEIGSLPPEAIEKVEVLPEQAALRFGFPPTRRVVNFITKRRFRQYEGRVSAGTTTELGSTTQKANLGLTRLHDDARLTLALEYRRTTALRQSDRHVLPDPAVPFDAVGNVLGVGGGEIDPALSAIAGHGVTIAPVPEAMADRTLAGFAAGADAARLFDLSPWRTLVPHNDAFKADLVIADRIGATLAGSFNLSAEQSRDRSVWGPATAILTVPDGNPFSPFSDPVLLYRYLTEAPPMRSRETTTTLHAGATIRGAISGWRWDFTAALDQKQVDRTADRTIDVTDANAAIAAGTNPFAPLDASLVADRLTDVTRVRTRSAELKLVVTNQPFRLPAGPVSITATAEAGWAWAASESRGPSPSEFSIGRARIEGGIALDVPLASRREGFLPFLGELSANASANVRRVGGFGTLSDTTLGAAWAPVEGIQFTATLRHSASAPDMAALSTPVTQAPNVPVFDYGSGETVLTTVIRGGNPALAAERRQTRSFGVTIKPFAKSQLRFGASWESADIHDQTGSVFAISPQTEASLPQLFDRDASGRLISVTYHPVNFFLERQRSLVFSLNSSGTIGKAPPAPPPAPGTKPAPPPRVNYWAGAGPVIRFADDLQLSPGAPVLDLIDGDTINGGARPNVTAWFYAGVNYLGHGANIDGWIEGPNHVNSANPASQLILGGSFRLNASAYVALHQFFKDAAWTRGMQLRLEVSNLTNWHRHLTDGNGNVPARYQRDLLDPIGRTITLSLRKRF